MYLRCPDCKTRYEISAARIPDGGARVRCPRCRTVFHVSRPLNGNGAEPIEDELREAPNGAMASAVEFGAGGEADTTGVPAAASDQPAAPEEPPAPTETAAPDESPAPAFAYAPRLSPGEAGAAPAPSASRVPPARPVVAGAAVDPVTARRIARAILSDLASARAEQRDAALREGRVLSTLGPAIAEAWEDYRRRVGPTLARGTPHFRDALNEFLGNGEPLL